MISWHPKSIVKAFEKAHIPLWLLLIGALLIYVALNLPRGIGQAQETGPGLAQSTKPAVEAALLQQLTVNPHPDLKRADLLEKLGDLYMHSPPLYSAISFQTKEMRKEGSRQAAKVERIYREAL